MSVHDLTLYDVLERNAQIHSDQIALVTETGQTVTFAALRDRVDRLAAGLQSLGLQPSERLAILAQNSAQYVELYFACARQGVIAYPINWRLQPEEVAVLTHERAKPRAFVADSSFLESVPGGPSEGRIEHWLQLGADAADGYRALDSLYLEGGSERPEVRADDPCAVIATAAVDVVPRGALLSHRNLLCSNVQEIAALSLNSSDCNLVALPLFHIAALGHALAVFHAGGCNVVTEKFDAHQAVSLIDQHQVTMISDFPPVLTSVLDAAEAAGSRLPSLRHVTGLDAPDTMKRLHETTDATFWTGFGQTETSGFVTLQNAREQLGSAGKPAELCAIRLVDDFDQDVPIGEPGEIVVRGPMVFLGYDGQEDVTEHTFRGGWHHTGDVGRFDEDGVLYYVKRKPEKELIKPGGENVYPAEVEAALVAIDGVEAACVFGVSDERWGEAIRAVVEVNEGFALDAEAVRGEVGQRIARFKRPRDVIFAEALPREDGSIDREQVKAQWGENAETGANA